MSCCREFVRYTMFFVNIIFSLFGILILIGGILGLVYKKHVEAVPPALFISVIVVGAVLFFIAFCGCCGAIKENECLVLTYSIILLLLAIVKIAVVIYLLVNKPTWRDDVADFVSILKDNHLSTKSEARVQFSLIEFAGQCCGTTGPGSYTKIIINNKEDLVPISCCPFSLKSNSLFCEKDKANQQGCSSYKSIDKAMNIINIGAYVGIGVALFEIAGFISAVYLSCTIKSHKYSDYD